MTGSTTAGSTLGEADVLAAALASLPSLSPPLLAALLPAAADEAEVWADLHSRPGAVVRRMTSVTGRAPALVATWSDAARSTDLVALAEAHERAAVRVVRPGASGYPTALVDDPEAPAVLFLRGRDAALERPTVAVIGTRTCTHGGREIARWIGQRVVECGGAVVSGLALGVDGAAHAGALRAATHPAVVGVVGSGLDRPYPARHAALWQEVGERGLLVSEAPLGAAPAPWRFPARNRVIAALASVVVVVESHASGGSLLTARQAAERGRTVLAVPGSMRSPASAGTNALLRDGAVPLADFSDLVVAMALAGTPLLDVAAGDGVEGDQAPEGVRGRSPEEEKVLDAVGFEPVSTEVVIARSGLAAGAAMAALRRLEATEVLVRVGGGRWERR